MTTEGRLELAASVPSTQVMDLETLESRKKVIGALLTAGGRVSESLAFLAQCMLTIRTFVNLMEACTTSLHPTEYGNLE